MRPLRDRERVRPPAAPPARPAVAPDAPAPTRFEIERAGETLRGWSPGFDRRRLRRLERGDPAPERSVDLHGLDAEGARRALREALADALEAGERCLRVVHGRGLHSAAGAVLKDALPGWLAEPPFGPRVLAFASAPAQDGGPGASYVLLRRAR